MTHFNSAKKQYKDIYLLISNINELLALKQSIGSN